MEMVGALVYLGTDPTGLQISGTFAGTSLAKELIDKNKISIRSVIDVITTELKYVFKPEGYTLNHADMLYRHAYHMKNHPLTLVSLGSEDIFERKEGELPRDRLRRMGGKLMLNQLSETISRHFDKTCLPVYSHRRSSSRHEKHGQIPMETLAYYS
jgi:hypothetical protein